MGSNALIPWSKKNKISPPERWLGVRWGERPSRAPGEHLEPAWACLKTSGETEVDSAIRVHVPEHCITSFTRYIILLQHETGRLATLTRTEAHMPEAKLGLPRMPPPRLFLLHQFPLHSFSCSQLIVSRGNHGGRALCANLSLFMTSPLTFSVVSISPSWSDSFIASSHPSATAGASNPSGQSRKEAPELGKGWG